MFRAIAAGWPGFVGLGPRGVLLGIVIIVALATVVAAALWIRRNYVDSDRK